MWRRTFNRLVQALIILTVAYYTLIGGFVTGIREYPWRVTTEIITTFLLGGWLLKKLVKKEELSSTPLDWPILGLLLASILSAAFSTDPRVSWENVFLNILLALSFYFTLELVSNATLKIKLVNAVLAVGAVISVVGLVEFWQWYGGRLVSEANWRSTGLSLRLSDAIRIKSVLHNPNYLAYYLLAVLGLSLGKVVNSDRRWKRIGWSGYTVMILGTVVLTQSRGGSLGVLAVFLSFPALLGAIRFQSDPAGHSRRGLSRVSGQTGGGRGRKEYPLAPKTGPGESPRLCSDFLKFWHLFRRSGYGVIIVMGLIISVLFIWIIAGRTNFAGPTILNERREFWLASLKMWQDHPLTGTGAGTFPVQYLKYRDFNAGGVGFIITHAHNLWFTLVAEYGLLGLSVALWATIVFATAVYRSFRQARAGPEAIWLAAGIATLAGQFTHNLFDDFLEFPAFTWHTIFLGTLCLASQQQPARPAGTQRWLRQALPGIVAGLAVAASALYFNRGFAAYHRAVQASQENDWPQTAAWLEQAVTLDPANKFYRQQLALSYGWLAYANRRQLPKAIAAQQTVIDRQTPYPLDYAHLACLQWEQGQSGAAIAAMAYAVQTEAPTSNYAGLKSWHTGQITYRFNLGYYHESLGETEQAQTQYRQSILGRPEIAGSIFWQQTPERKQLLQKILEEIRHEPVAYETIAKIYYFAGNYQTLLDLSRTELSRSNDNASARLMTVIALIELGEEDQALTIFNGISQSQNPDYAPVYLDIANRLRQAKSDLPDLETAIQTAAVLQGNAASPIIYYYWGQLAETQHNLEQAKSKYRQAIFRATAIDTDYANLIGRRVPLARETFPCLLLPFAERELSAPSLRLAALYESTGEPEAAKDVYENLLLYEPYNHLARERLARLGQTHLNQE